MAEWQSCRVTEVGSCGIRELQDCVVDESRSYRVTVLKNCRDAEPQRFIHSLELQGYIITELLSPRVAEAYQGIVNWEPGISGLGNRGVGWLGLGWGRVRDLRQAYCACW